MPVKTHVTKIEATGEGGVLVSVVVESDLGPIDLGIEGNLKADAAHSVSGLNIPGVAEEVSAFLWREGLNDATDLSQQTWNCVLGSLA